MPGVVRGSGKQKIGALANLGAYYLAGIPSGALLAFVYHIGGKVALTLSLVFLPTSHIFFLVFYSSGRRKINPFVYFLGPQGLWIGITVALFVQASSLSIIILCIDWKKEV